MKEKNMEILMRMVANGYANHNLEWKAENFSTEEILKWEANFMKWKEDNK